MLPSGQVFEASGAEVDALTGYLEGVLVPQRKTWNGALCTLDLRDAGAGTLLMAAHAVRGALPRAPAEGAGLLQMLAAEPRSSPHPASTMTADEVEDIGRALQLGVTAVEAIRATWLSAPAVADTLAQRVLAHPSEGDALAVIRLLPVERRGAAWLAIASDPREPIRCALFEMLAPRHWSPGTLPLETTPADALQLLARGCSDSSGRVRALAVQWARLIGYVSSIAGAVKEGITDLDPDYRRQCLRTLGEVGDDEARHLARAAVERADSSDVHAAIVSLKTLDDAEGIVRACLDPRPVVRIAGAEALLHSRTITAPLLARMQPPAPELQFAFDVCRRRLNV
ncbi:hypothetical protein BE04_15320 [Sorangium cellulosum]|uniref:PBS lyase n=2 Tax=Sorangium cellulosum TaxID=56 RepID=A0A150PLX9_SORCE|nr:hypothetical protein SCE1572_48620 [Sorangium cellulosum So0157-2]KYF56695.1 hypothetical protein BE04_15320 [Sorangium cellulosum]